MAVSESQKKASIKWDKENMATLGCKVKRDQAEKFKEKCRANNTTANEVLKECVLNYIGETSATEFINRAISETMERDGAATVAE